MAELPSIHVYIRSESGDSLLATMAYHEIVEAIPASVPYLEAPRHERVVRCARKVIRRLYLRLHEIPEHVIALCRARDRAIERRGGHQTMPVTGIGRLQGGNSYVDKLPSGHAVWAMRPARIYADHP